MNHEQQAADTLYKTHFGKMVSAMLQFSRDINLETAEDLVQDAFCAALTTWKIKGIPQNPAGWMYTVCRNNAINAFKKNKTFKNPFEDDVTSEVEALSDEDIFDDRKMQLLFACANPRLSAKMQVVITLKYVVNLRTESIANALGMTIDGIDKTLSRAKQRIRIENIFLKEPTRQQMMARLPVVHKIIYLLFNEGYRAGSGKELIRQDLCEESLIITKLLLDTHICNHNTSALYALLLFNAARLNARFTATGELTDMKEQDRNLWNYDLIMLADYHLDQSQCENISSYHYEAAIAYLHCHAKNFADTDWGSIVKLYKQLLQNNPNPFIELNYAIALYYNSQKQEAFSILHNLQHTFLGKSYLLHTTLGKLYLMEEEHHRSNLHFTKALSLTNFRVEKDFIRNSVQTHL
jgi:RNA polymerase sigma-70 factor (ECF subfamily)